ncbi:MAG: DUF6382 domain-containing protein [Lachnospiraceae bacterium]
MEIGYKREIDATALIIEIPVIYEEDYQIQMLDRNSLEGVLKVRGQGVDNCSRFCYDVSGKVSMKTLFDNKKIKKKDIQEFMEQMLQLVKILRLYMLDTDHIFLSPEYIFYETGRYYFCYCPLQDDNLRSQFHKLTEYFVSKVDYDEKDAIYIAYTLHKATMEENYSIEKIILSLSEKTDLEEENWIQKKSKNREEHREKADEIDYVEELNYQEEWECVKEDDWITSQEMGTSILREKKESWFPIKKLWKRRQKPKWGEWDDLQQEDSR